jgi:aspartate/methionine/tyrosine aminotransferase
MKSEGWENILTEYIQSKINTVFEWGQNDCILFAFGFVDLVTNSNFMQHKGKCSNEVEAYQYLQSLGFESVEDCVDFYLTRKNVRLAQRGDIVCFSGTLGVCDGRLSYFLTENNMIKIPTLKCHFAWSI